MADPKKKICPLMSSRDPLANQGGVFCDESEVCAFWQPGPGVCAINLIADMLWNIQDLLNARARR